MIDTIQFLRTLDKHDRLGDTGVRDLLMAGRRDESGDFTPGCGLTGDQADAILHFINSGKDSRSNEETIARMARWFSVMSMPAAEIDKLHNALDKVGMVG